MFKIIGVCLSLYKTKLETMTASRGMNSIMKHKLQNHLTLFALCQVKDVLGKASTQCKNAISVETCPRLSSLSSRVTNQCFLSILTVFSPTEFIYFIGVQISVLKLTFFPCLFSFPGGA